MMDKALKGDAQYILKYKGAEKTKLEKNGLQNIRRWQKDPFCTRVLIFQIS